MKAVGLLVRDDLGRCRVRILNTSKARALPGRECGRAEPRKWAPGLPERPGRKTGLIEVDVRCRGAVALWLRFRCAFPGRKLRFPGEIRLLNAAYHAVGLGTGSPSWRSAKSHTIAI